jgi:hypothetical protein
VSRQWRRLRRRGKLALWGEANDFFRLGPTPKKPVAHTAVLHTFWEIPGLIQLIQNGLGERDMARRKKSSRKRRKVRRKKRTARPAKAAALPVTLPPFGWNTDDQSANQVARQIAERQRQNVASAFGGQGNTIIDTQLRRAPETIHAEILKHITAIEEIIPQLPGLGHNKPPEPIETPLTSDEIAEINVHITVMNSLPAVPTQLPTTIGLASERLKILGDKIVRYAAITGGITTLWDKFGDHLMAAGNLIAEWIKMLMHIF